MIHDDVRLLDPKDLLGLCSCLISYDDQTTKVTLAHSSVFDYLSSKEIRNSDVSSFYIDRGVTYQAIPTRCIRYIMLPAFASGCCSEPKHLVQRLEDWPLLAYIAETLFDHLEFVDLNDKAFVNILMRFFATHNLPHGGNFGAWVQAFFPPTTYNIHSSTPLYYAARFGLLLLVRLLLKTQGNEDLEKPGGVYGSTPLHVACWAGRTEVVKELLQAGANVHKINFDGTNGLYWAIMSGYKSIERMLRDKGAVFSEKLLWKLGENMDEQE